MKVAFDDIAHTYDEWYQTPLGRFVDKIETDLLFDLFKIAEGDLIIDAGCGTGNFSLKLACKGARVVGVDISLRMLTIAREKAACEGLDVDFVEMDLHRLGFPDDTFDGAVSVTTFEFLMDPNKAFSELMRVLKPGGQLLIGTINRESPWGELYMRQAERPDSIYRHARFMTLEELINLDKDRLERTGECLFIRPDCSLEEINVETEKLCRAEGKGGFIAALWKKPL